MRRQVAPPNVPGIVRAEEQPTPAVRAEVASPAEHGSGRRDRRWAVPPLRQDARLRSAVVRVVGTLAAGTVVLFRPPPHVPALHDAVQLVVAIRPGFRFP